MSGHRTHAQAHIPTRVEIKTSSVTSAVEKAVLNRPEVAVRPRPVILSNEQRLAVNIKSADTRSMLQLQLFRASC